MPFQVIQGEWFPESDGQLFKGCDGCFPIDVPAGVFIGFHILVMGGDFYVWVFRNFPLLVMEFIAKYCKKPTFGLFWVVNLIAFLGEA